MTTLSIDNRALTLDSSRIFELALDVVEATSLEGKRRSVKIALPGNAHNMSIIGDVGGVFSRERFNNTSHEARIETDGCVVFYGIAHMQSVEYLSQCEVWYNMVITELCPEWIDKAAQDMFRETALTFEETISTGTIRESWTWDKPVRFLPVQRDTLLVRNSGATVVPPVRVLTAEDYHPFLHVKSILRAIIESAGYKMVSAFADTPLFESLYMSGNYPQQDTETLKSRINFNAGRFDDRSAPADRFGVVKADPYSTLNSIGNIVETADPTEIRDEKSAEGVFNVNDAFRIEDERAAFVPLTEVRVGFEFNIKYRTPYLMISREELSGFNSVTLIDGIEHNYKLINNFSDHKQKLEGGKNYMFIVFDHDASASYQLRYDRGTNQQDIQNVIHSTFTSRTLSVTLASGYILSGMTLWIKASGGSSFSPCVKDWALYDGFVTESGNTEVEICLKSAAQKVTPGNPKYFDTIYFSGAPEGSLLTICKETSVRPIFSANPAMGSKVLFADVAAHQVRQIKFVESLRHLFNLRFYTDNYAREVYIEPYDSFFDRSVPIDWSGRADTSKPVLIEEPGAGMSKTNVLMFKDGDDAVAAYDSDNFTKTGRWSFSIENTLAKNSTTLLSNPMFTPTLSLSDVYPDAPSALFMQVGLRDPYPVEREDSLNFLAKIVRYMGMVDLPAGEVWGWPTYLKKYPFAAFHYPDSKDGFSLCFEDRDGIAGIHRFYDMQAEQLNSSRRITAYMKIEAEDMEAMLIPNMLRKDFRSLFRISVDDEPVVCCLESIEGYDPQNPESVKCVFLSIT